MPLLASYIAQVYDNKPSHPNGLLEGQIFGTPLSAPCLEKTQTNRVLIYPGSFNPPHRGHLQLLKHTFIHGVHDLNVIAAIIVPRCDESVLKKCKKAGGQFMFGLDERSLLWEQDLAFPGWAWVYRDRTREFSAFLERLRQAIKKDGYEIEFVMLYGPEIGSPEDPPKSVYGCQFIIMSDAGRRADYQRSNGRLKDFQHCTRWKRVRVDKDQLERCARSRAQDAVTRRQTINPNDAQSMLEDGHGFVERTTLANVARAVKDLEHVLQCRHNLTARAVTLRFVKSTCTARKSHWIRKISSSRLREVMRIQSKHRVKGALEEMALSAEVLIQQRPVWVDAAKQGENSCINFPATCVYDNGSKSDDQASVDCLAGSSVGSDVSDLARLVEDEKNEEESKEDKGKNDKGKEEENTVQ